MACPGLTTYPRLIERLKRRGIVGDELAGMLHRNFLGLFRAALMGNPSAP
jgi:microsomal dipeptidase-like Zn-dependent dipeptidase